MNKTIFKQRVISSKILQRKYNYILTCNTFLTDCLYVRFRHSRGYNIGFPTFLPTGAWTWSESRFTHHTFFFFFFYQTTDVLVSFFLKVKFYNLKANFRFFLSLQLVLVTKDFIYRDMCVRNIWGLPVHTRLVTL